MIPETVRLHFGFAIDRELSFLRSLGYQFIGVTEDATEALGPRLSGGYTNTAVKRTVRVVYLLGDKVRRSVAITDVVLIVPDTVDEFDFTTLQSMQVSVTDFSAFKDFATGFSQYLNDAAHTLWERFSEVLAGRIWKSDVLDWGEMK